MKCCPKVDQLDQLLAEQLADWEREAVEAPIEGCTICQGLMERLVEGIPGWREVRSRAAGRPPRHPLSVALLSRLSEALPFSTTSPSLDGANTPDLTPPKTLDQTAGRPTVPGYQILGELGRGGMGVVYQALQMDLGRIVALKMLLAGVHAGLEERARFRREAEDVARLQHPHVVQIFEIGEHDGLSYLALEFVEGGSLAQKLQARHCPLRKRRG